MWKIRISCTFSYHTKRVSSSIAMVIVQSASGDDFFRAQFSGDFPAMFAIEESFQKRALKRRWVPDMAIQDPNRSTNVKTTL